MPLKAGTAGLQSSMRYKCGGPGHQAFMCWPKSRRQDSLRTAIGAVYWARVPVPNPWLILDSNMHAACSMTSLECKCWTHSWGAALGAAQAMGRAQTLTHRGDQPKPASQSWPCRMTASRAPLSNLRANREHAWGSGRKLAQRSCHPERDIRPPYGSCSCTSATVQPCSKTRPRLT